VGRNFVTVTVTGSGGAFSVAANGTSLVNITATDVTQIADYDGNRNRFGLIDFILVVTPMPAIPALGAVQEWNEVHPGGWKLVAKIAGVSFRYKTWEVYKRQRQTFSTEAGAIGWGQDYPGFTWRQVGRFFVADRIGLISEWCLGAGGSAPWYSGTLNWNGTPPEF
jgi:hypothetical protein